MHFLGFKWNNDNFSPSIQYTDAPNIGEVKFKDLKAGSVINIEIEKKKFCTGYFSDPGYEKKLCEYKSELPPDSSSQCDSCRFHDSALFLPLGILKDYQRKIIEKQEHLNYINLFGKDIYKTGVAAKVRKYTRIHEQGSHASLFFTECNGVIAREIEEFISINLSIKQSINVLAKIKSVYDYPSKEEASDKLHVMYSEIIKILPEKYKQYLLKEPEFVYNIDFYFLKDKENIIYEAKDIYNISGTIKNIIGELLLLVDNKNRLLVLNSKLMLGHVIHITENSAFQPTPSENLKEIILSSSTKNLSLF